MHDLQQRIEALRRRVIRLWVLHSLSAIVAAVVVAVIALGWIDYRVRFRDHGVLAIFSAIVLGVFAWAVLRCLRRLRRMRLNDTDLALQMEACFPALRDRLASAVEFLKQSEDDAAAGSAALRRAAIAQTAARCYGVDFAAAIDQRPAVRAAVACLFVCLLAAVAVVWNPKAARIALARLAAPLAAVDWPQVNRLVLRQPVERIARGQPLEIQVADSGGAALPADCRVHYRFRDAQGKTSEETEPMQLLGATMIARRENVTRPLEFRVTGGDDRDMPWNRVDVLEPPAIHALSIEITPPDYVNRPVERRDAAEAGPLLAGSRVRLFGQATKPLASAVLWLEGGRELPAQISPDGLAVTAGEPSSESPAGLVLEKTVGYSLKLLDRDGIRGGEESRQLQVVADAPPRTTIEQPGGNLYVTPRAVLDLQVKAADDLAIRQVSLVCASSGATAFAERTLRLYEGPEKAAPRASAAGEYGPGDELRTFNQTWDLEELRLAPGAVLTVHAAAIDYRGQTGRSDSRTLTVVSPEDLQDRLAARQSQIQAELARVLQLQHDAAAQVREAEIRLQQSGNLEQAAIDRLQAAEFSQREIARSLTDCGNGLPALILGLLADVRSNRIDNPDLTRRMQNMLDEFDRLQRERLPPIAMELTAAVKGAQTWLQAGPHPGRRDEESKTHLTAAGGHQQEVVRSLKGMLAELRQWDDYRRFHREVAQLLRDQEDLARTVARLGRQTLGRDVKELSGQESADLAIQAERQMELARRQTRIEQEMEQAIGMLGSNEPLAADTLTDALNEARRLAIAGSMRTAGEEIRNNEMGLAPAEHQKVLDNLQEVLDILANNRRQELGRLDRKLEEAAGDLDGLRRRQEGLRRKIEAAAAPPTSADPKGQRRKAELQQLARQQEELRREAEPLKRRLERLLAEEAAKSVGKAAERMNEGCQAGEGDEGPKAGRAARDAEEALGDAVRLLKNRRFQVKAELAVEQMARLEDAVKHLGRQEERILAETREFAELERKSPLSRAQVSGLLELGRQQGLLRDETDRLLRAMESANAFRLALSAAAEEMNRAAALLDRRQTGPATQQAEQVALSRLKMLLAALEPEKKANGAGNGGNADRPEPGPTGLPLALAQLKLLKLMQEDLNVRTQQLDQTAAGKPAEQFRQQYALLADEQGRLAATAIELLGTGPAKGPEGKEPP